MSINVNDVIEMLLRFRGYGIPRVSWAVSATNTLSNRDVNMDAADDWIEGLERDAENGELDDAEFSVYDAEEAEAKAVAEEADCNAGFGGQSYSGYTWQAVEIEIPARGYRNGIRTILYLPKGGW